MKVLLQAATLTALIMVATMSEAQTLRATDIDSSTWGKVFSGQMNGVTIEFRQGDELPMTFSAEGDFFETRQIYETPVSIKKSFWMKVSKNIVLFSLDGSSYKPLPQVASGNFLFGAGSNPGDARANTLNMQLKAYMK
jgi:hypothetical protein